MSERLRNKWREVLDIRESNSTHDFRLFNAHDMSYGDSYVDRGIAYTNLIRHESINNILDTIIHEDLHMALKREAEDMDSDFEHELIKWTMWTLADMTDI